MKKEFVMWIVIAALVIGTLFLGTTKADQMAIDFEAGSYPQYVTFGEIDSLKGLTQKTVCAWVKPESLSEYQHIFNINTQLTFQSGEYSHAGGYQLMLSNGKIRFVSHWSGVSGGHAAVWDSVETISAGNIGLACVSYDNSSENNNPVLYVNGNLSDITEVVSPAGTLMDYATDYTPSTKIGISYTNTSSDVQLDGVLYKILVYDRILTAAEVAQMYVARGRDNIRKGLVFCPMLYGAKGLQIFDGATLAAGNTIVDPCSGALGIPAGNPVGIVETYLSTIMR